jgi:hypothetical protein
MSGQLHAPDTLPLGKEPWYPLDRRLGGPQSVWTWSRREKFSAPTGNGTPEPRSSSPQPVTIPTKVPWFFEEMVKEVKVKLSLSLTKHHTMKTSLA